MAQEKQKSFIMYDEYAQHVSLLSDAELGALMRAVFSYRLGGEVPELPDKAAMAFSFIKMRLDDDARRYEETCSKNKSNGARGGRPRSADSAAKTERFSKETEKTERFFEKPKKPDNDIDTDVDVELDNDSKKQDGTAKAVPYRQREVYRAVADKYTQICKSLPPIKVLSDKRKHAIKVMLAKEIDFDALFANAEQSDFLSGRNGKWRGCNFDWLMNYNNALKVLEGSYSNTKNKDSPFEVYDSGRYDYDEIDVLARKKLKQVIRETSGRDNSSGKDG